MLLIKLKNEIEKLDKIHHVKILKYYKNTLLNIQKIETVSLSI